MKKENCNGEIEEKLKQIVETSLQDECLSVEKNDESSDGNVYIICGEKKKYVAKIYDDVQHFKSMIDLHNNISLSINIPKIIYTNLNDKNFNDKYIVIYSFISGKPINQTLKDCKVEDALIVEIAKTIKKMHDIVSNGNLFNLPELPFDTVNKRKTMLHFDLTKSNIFLDDDNKISVIDFDDAMYGSAIYDIAILISTFFFSKSRGVDIEGMNVFLNAYYECDTSLKEEETQYIKECSIQWIDYLITSGKLPEKLVNSFQTKRILISENL